MSKKQTETEKTIAKVMDKIPIALDANVLYKEFITMSNIEKVKEEDYVMRELLRGTSKNKIIENLSAKYPESSFSYDDIEKFMARNQEVVRAMGKEVNLSARRHMQAKAQCAEQLAELALYTKFLIPQLKAEGDNTNTVAAIRALRGTLETYMKLEGMVGPDVEGGKVINVINQISDNKAKIKEKLHSANFVDINEDDEED